MDTMVAFGNVFRKIQQKIANKLSVLKRIPHPMMMNLLRSKLTAMLHKHYEKMIIASMQS